MIGMKLCDLLNGSLAMNITADNLVAGIVTDNRDVKAGDLFVALAGAHHHGRQFIADAISRGCSAILVETEQLTTSEKISAVPVFAVAGLKALLPVLLARFYHSVNFDKLNLLAVTGTNGKSSIVRFITQLAAACDTKAAIMGTLGYGIWPDVKASKNTTPEQAVVLRQLHDMQQQGAQLVAMEVSSHGIAEKRIAGIAFNGAVFCNLSQDHLDFHGDMESYFQTKRQLFVADDLSLAVICADDEYGQRLLKDTQVCAQKISYGLAADADVHASNVSMNQQGLQADITTPWGKASISVPLIGEFNLNNVLASIAALVASGQFSLAEVLAHLDVVTAPPGRMETYLSEQSEHPLAIVDFAHTPDAISTVLKTLKPHARRRLAIVFGCGGNRDQEKRALMGQASEVADQIWLTSDNPRTESIDEIISMIKTGIRNTAATVEIDRSQAIIDAVNELSGDDILLVAGKGHEDYQEIAGKKIAYSDAGVLTGLGYRLASGGYQ